MRAFPFSEPSSMKILRVPNIPKLNNTPLAMIRVRTGHLVVEADDEHENRVRLVFAPFQMVRITTTDCFSVPKGLVVEPGWVVEILDSPLVTELRTTLARVDETARFMDRARHFLVPGGDEYIDVVAWDLRIEGLGSL
jgi:hypothetical protein